jgi:hypothetical protein
MSFKYFILTAKGGVIMPKNRKKTKENAKLGRSLRAEFAENGFTGRDECGIKDPTAAAALRNIAYHKAKNY